MEQLKIAVTGASGKTARAVTAALQARGARVKSIGCAEMVDLAAALEGCTALYLIAPNMHPDEPAFVQQVLEASRHVGVEHVVYHSVVAPYAPSMPHHVGKAVSENLVRRSAPAWTLLQPCAYTQNFLPALRGGSPALEVAYDPDQLFGFVDLEDVAQAAATVLLDDGHHGATYELGGPVLCSVRDVASAAGRVLGRAVPVRRLTPAQWAAGVDLPERVRDGLLAMFDYYDAYGLPAGSVALGALLGRTSRSVYDVLARELA